MFRMPAEWAPHAATWLAWPHEESDWPGKFEPIPWLYGEIVAKLARVERVRILVQDDEHREGIREILQKVHANLDAVDFYLHQTNRSWTRDFCPIFVKDAGSGEVAITDWIFNGWAKYDNWADDNAIPEFVANQLGKRRFAPGMVLEGGSIDVNGSGKLLTTEECLLSHVQCRNPGWTREQIEAKMREFLGIEEVIWLKDGIAGDDTHGHVDDLARFAGDNKVVTVLEEDKSDYNYEPTHENLALLRQRGDLEVITLPMPSPVYFDGQRLPASYANFYIANNLVLVPTFQDRNDRIALNTIAELFPDREVVGIACTDLVLGLGTLHCMTQQEPA